MAREKASNVGHQQVTDHFIQKRPSAWLAEEPPQNDQLVAVGGEAANDRDLGLAYAQLVIAGDTASAGQAGDLLRRAEREEKKRSLAASDADLHAKLGYVDLVSNDMPDAVREYEAALAIDPAQSIAEADLAVIRARHHRLDEAIPHWRKVLEENAAQTGAGYDLALAECMVGEEPAAVQDLERAISFSPDDQTAKKLLLQLQAAPAICAAEARRHR